MVFAWHPGDFAVVARVLGFARGVEFRDIIRRFFTGIL